MEDKVKSWMSYDWELLSFSQYEDDENIGMYNDTSKDFSEILELAKYHMEDCDITEVYIFMNLRVTHNQLDFNAEYFVDSLNESECFYGSDDCAIETNQEDIDSLEEMMKETVKKWMEKRKIEINFFRPNHVFKISWHEIDYAILAAENFEESDT